MQTEADDPQALRSALLRTWVGVLLISFSAIFVRLADVEPARSALLRTAYALPAFAALLLWQRRRGASTGRVFVPLAVAAGAFLGFDLLAWHEAIRILGAGIATILPNVQVVFVGVIGVLVFRERPRPWFWAALPVVLVGVWLLGATGEPLEVGGSVAAGIGFGLVTAVCYSAFLVLLRLSRLSRPGSGSIAIMTAATIGATVVNATVAGAQGVAGPAGNVEADLWLLVLALGPQVLGWTMLTSSIHRLPAALTSVALLVQPVLTLVWGTVLLDEPIGAAQIIGAVVVLAGVAVAHHAVVAGTRRGAEAERAAAATG